MKDFDRAWGLKPTQEQEHKRFVARINATLFSDVSQSTGYWALFHKVCYFLGIDPEPHLVHRQRAIPPIVPPHFRDFCEDSFYFTMRVITCIYRASADNENRLRVVNHFVESAINEASGDLGVVWKDGMFYPRGAKELDDKLVHESLAWLSRFPSVQKDYRDALTALVEGRPGDAVNNAYQAIEGLAQNVLKNQQNLSNNKTDFLKWLKPTREWGGFIGLIFGFSNEFGRHANDKGDPKPHEVEGYVYAAGVIIRMASMVDR